MVSMIARPTTTSAAATVMIMSAKIWPSNEFKKLEYPIRRKFTAFNINSTDMNMTSGFLRMTNPKDPMENIAALINASHDQVLVRFRNGL